MTRRRPLPVLAGVLAAGLMLAVAGCGGVTPLGPDSPPALPQPHQLRSPLVLEDMRMEHSEPGGGCPAGSAEYSGDAPGCYRVVGASATITSAGVSAVASFRPPTPSGQQQEPAQYGFWITVPAADAPAVNAVITATEPTGSSTSQSSSGSQGPVASAASSAQPVPAISLAGQTSLLVGYSVRLTGRETEVFLASKNQADQFQRMLTSSS